MKRRLTLWLALSLIFSSLPVTGAGATETATALDTEAVSEIAQEDSSNEGVSVETEATDSAEEDKDETKAVEQVQEGSVNQGITSEENAFEPVESINQDTAFEEDAAEAVTIDEEIAAIVEPVEVTEGKNVKYTSSVEAGWQKINNKWYYFGKYGAMQHGFMTQDGKKYYFGSDGAMVTGWQEINGNWYFFSTGGAMQTDWQKISGRWYYLGSNGVMRTGWLTINNCRYYFQSGGSMVTGWQKIGSNWYCKKSDLIGTTLDRVEPCRPVGRRSTTGGTIWGAMV